MRMMGLQAKSLIVGALVGLFVLPKVLRKVR